MKIRALVAASLLIIALPWVPAVAAQGTTITEDFEDEDILDEPDTDIGNWSTSGGVSGFVTDVFNNTGTQSLSVRDTGVAGVGGWQLIGNLCNGGSISFWVMRDAWATGPQNRAFALTGSLQNDINTEESIWIDINPLADTFNILVKGTSTTDIVTGVTYPGNSTWVDFTFSNIDCTEATVRVGSATVGQTWDMDAGGTLGNLDYFVATDQSTTDQYDGQFYVDDVKLSNVEVITTINSAQTVAVDNLNSMVADVTGKWLMTRQTGTTNAVASYDAIGLSSAGSDSDDFCNVIQGIAAYPEAIFYTSCTLGGGDIDAIEVRSPDFTDAPAPDGCGNECRESYSEVGWTEIEIPDTMVDLHTLDFYIFSTGGVLGAKHATSAFTFSTSSGRIGVIAFTANNLAADTSDITSVLFSTQAPSDTCFWRSPAGDDYMGAVTQSGPTSFYEVKVDVKRSTAGDFFPETSFDLYYTNPSAYAEANSIACAGNIAAVKTASDVKVFQVVPETGKNQGLLLHSFETTGSSTRGIALSGDGKFLLYEDGSNFKVADLSTGAVQGALPPPSGTFRDVAMDGNGRLAWIATNSTIAKYLIEPVTCGDDCSSSVFDGAGRLITEGGVSQGTSDGVLSGAGAAAGGAFGVSDTAGGFFFGFIVIAATTTAGIAGLPQARVLGAVGGAIGGLVLGWVLSFIPAAFMFALVVLAGGAIAYKLINGREMGT